MGEKVVNTARAMVASGLEAGAAGVLAVHADAHLERGPQSPCPDSAHTGSVGRRRRNRRGARGTQLQLVADVVGASQFFSHQCHALLAAALARCSRCGHRRLAHRHRAARRQRARPSVALFTTNRHSLECSRGAPNLLKLLAHHLLASYTHAHPSIHATSITVTHTRVCNTVSDTFPALT